MIFKTILIYFPLLIVTFFSSLAIASEQEAIDRHIRNKELEIRRLANNQKNISQFLKSAKKSEWRILEVLKVLNDNVKESQARLEEIQSKINEAEFKIFNQNNEIENSQKKIDQDLYTISDQLENIQKLKTIRESTLFPNVKFFKNYQRNQKLLQISTKIDAETVHQLKKNLSLLESQQKVLKQHQTELFELREEEQEKADLVAFEERQQLAYLEHIRSDRNRRIEYLSEIQEEIEYLNSYIFSLQKQKTLARSKKNFNGFRNEKGKRPHPVEGRLLSRFGDSDSDESLGHQRGVLVRTPGKVGVKAFLTGKVVFTGPFRGFHQLVILDHGKSCFSVYGYLKRVFVKQDDIIETGQIIGNVTYHPSKKQHLFYFETRYRGKAVDPLIWLKKPVWKYIEDEK